MKTLLQENATCQKEGRMDNWLIVEKEDSSISAHATAFANKCLYCNTLQFSSHKITSKTWEGMNATSSKIIDVLLSRQNYKCNGTGCGMCFPARDWPYLSTCKMTDTLINEICKSLLAEKKATEISVAKIYNIAQSKVSKALKNYISITKIDTLPAPICETLLFIPIKQSRSIRYAVLGVVQQGTDHDGKTVLLDILRGFDKEIIQDFIVRRSIDVTKVKYLFLELHKSKDISQVFPNYICDAVYPLAYEKYISDLQKNIRKNPAFKDDEKRVVDELLSGILNGEYDEDPNKAKTKLDSFSAGKITEFNIRCPISPKTNVRLNTTNQAFINYKDYWDTIRDNIDGWLMGKRYLSQSCLNKNSIDSFKSILASIKFTKKSFELLQFKLLYQYNICYNHSNLAGYSQFLCCHLDLPNILKSSYFYIPIEELAYVLNRKDHLADGVPYHLSNDNFNDNYWEFIADRGNEFYTEIFAQHQTTYHTWLTSLHSSSHKTAQSILLEHIEQKFWELVNSKVNNEGWPFGILYVAESPDLLHIALLQTLDYIQIKVLSDYADITEGKM